MKTKRRFRNAFGLGQIMATLLVVLPTIAFSTTFLIEYWAVMQYDNNLKLIAKVASQYYDSKENITDITDINSGLLSLGAKLCPAQNTLSIKSSTSNTTANLIDIKVEYTTPADKQYFASKTLSTNSITYSYHDQNRSIVLECTKKEA